MKKNLTASEMGRESWKARKRKYTKEQLTKMMSENGRKGGENRRKKISTVLEKSA